MEIEYKPDMPKDVDFRSFVQEMYYMHREECDAWNTTCQFKSVEFYYDANKKFLQSEWEQHKQ